GYNRRRALKGIDTLSALTLATEAQDFRRFSTAGEFMSFTGLVGQVDPPSEYASPSGPWLSRDGPIRRRVKR
ncbi:MAG TPA: transposase, partial [Elusimicrobiales bacterium]|nr:transposase [Elusimicrobiales bacterium]